MNSNISGGMKKMFIAQIGAICCTVIAIIPIIGTLIGGIGALVFAVISMIGLWAIGQEVPECKTAFILTIVNAVLSLLTLIPVIGKIMDLASTIVSFLIIYLVCTSLSKVLSNAGAADVAKSADLIWKLELVCTILSLIITVLSWIPIINVIAAIIAIPVAIFAIVVGILYIIFLYKGSNALA